MSMKKASEELLKIADELEKDAAGVTQFVCTACNHTATLAKINGMRKEAASAQGSQIVVADVDVNDKIKCPACQGVMAYKETEASAPYYYDPDKKADDKPCETPAEEAAEKPEAEEKAAAVDYDSIK